MNDPNKRIDVNISSLLSLKAELLRKQEEVSRAKTKQTTEAFVPKKSGKSDKKDKPEEPSEPKVIEYEDSALLDKSRKVLEAKSRFYDKMTAAGGKLNSDDNCLVLFNQKKQEDKPYVESSSSSDVSDDEAEEGKYKSKYPEEDWVEYTDCLGRTRKCLKKDLEFFKKKDTQLAENIQPRIELNQNAPMWMIDTNPTAPAESEIRDDVSEMTSIMSKHDQMKMSWEKKEEENVYKENVHYQDVLFDEARTHGVGYYAFSTDEEERAKQRKALDEMREKTLESQQQRESQRLTREKIIAERVKAAKNRQRARLGLPPIEDEPVPEPKLFDTKEEEKRKKREAKEKRRKEKEEKLREQERKQHVRPWDRNKSGVRPTDNESESDNDEWNYKPEREPMSQEQWNERQREERKMEFAPMPEPTPPPPPKRSFRGHSDYNISLPDESARESLFFTSKKPQKPKEFIKRNYNTSNADDISNENDVDDTEDDDRIKGKGAEIPPPATFEYYGPSSSKRSKPAPKPNLEQSIAAGLKFLRDRSDKGILPPKSNWTANADY